MHRPAALCECAGISNLLKLSLSPRRVSHVVGVELRCEFPDIERMQLMSTCDGHTAIRDESARNLSTNERGWLSLYHRRSKQFRERGRKRKLWDVSKKKGAAFPAPDPTV